GHVVVGTTSRGEDALSRTLDTRADLVLMDIRLEGAVDGITAAQQIRDRCRVPVIFLTAYADDETTRRAGAAEPLGYLLKPFQEPQLLATIEMALYKHAADRRLRASEQRYETTLSSIGDGVISTDEAAAVTFMNPIAARLTGWPQAEALGRPLSEVFQIFDGRTGERLEDPAIRALRARAIVDLPPNTILRARGGQDIPIDDSSAPILAEDGQVTGTVLVFSDMTGQREAAVALRRAEAELARASRMTLLGEFAASIAHEVNQPLMAIVTNAESCLRWLGQDQPDIRRANDAAQRVVRNGHRAAEVIASLRALASNTSPRMVPLDLPATIEDALVLLRAELDRRNILLQVRFPAALPMVTGDRVQLQQVVANLVMNANEAIGEAEPEAEARTI
ncbi:MAG: hybrid sensor histidine kinase/response regulator, partial [Acetobacteraceae bacterium]